MSENKDVIKKRVSLSIDSDVLDKAKKEAKKENRSLSNYIQSLLMKIK